ncbi:hypothetical protein CEXT_152211 [Caerostris extrusa]|uniref:Uncharacterized protein n=1 Tax=Caerostris extrusa TaxID=172846 RepID=A0AAV4ND73_CAEEX|nr:hypothetical protein CEXT_152211 [Caerostris extrusa]
MPYSSCPVRRHFGLQNYHSGNSHRYCMPHQWNKYIQCDILVEKKGLRPTLLVTFDRTFGSTELPLQQLS